MINNNLDKQYLDILKDIYDNGIDSDNRTEITTKSLFCKQIRCDLKQGFPILTFRFHSFKIAFYETMMFLNGETDTIKWLESNNIFIWKGNTSREFLDKRNLQHLPVGDIGYSYGKIWNNFDGVNQLESIFNTLKTNPNDRRMILSAWHPAKLHEAALPPCHIMAQFYCKNNTLSCMFNMRSLDFWNGTGYDIMCYGLITFLFAKALNMEVGELVMNSTDTHLYNNGLKIYKNSIDNNQYFNLPKFNIKKDIKSLEDIKSLLFEDVELIDYKHNGITEKVPMSI
jgi:thymidylate synthase